MQFMRKKKRIESESFHTQLSQYKSFSAFECWIFQNMLQSIGNVMKFHSIDRCLVHDEQANQQQLGINQLFSIVIESNDLIASIVDLRKLSQSNLKSQQNQVCKHNPSYRHSGTHTQTVTLSRRIKSVAKTNKPRTYAWNDHHSASRSAWPNHYKYHSNHVFPFQLDGWSAIVRIHWCFSCGKSLINFECGADDFVKQICDNNV